MIPRRYQRRRTKEWTMPRWRCVRRTPHYVGNPFAPIRRCSSGPPDVVAMYEQLLADHPEIVDLAQQHLTGRALVCWCRLDQPRHADVLLKLANQHGEPT